MTAPKTLDGDASLKLLLCAVEPSADTLGAALMDALKAKSSTVKFMGCGGPLMEERGLKSIFPIAPLSVMGPVDAIKALPAALSGADAISRAAAAQQADAAVLIDSWAFSKIAAERIRRRSPQTKLFKLVAPQVWASRPHRAKTLAKLFDGVLTLFEFENEIFERENIATQFVGNPAYQITLENKTNGEAFREKYSLGDAPLLAVLPGSRRGEVKRLLEPFRKTVAILQKGCPDLRVVIPVAPAVEEDVRANTSSWETRPILIGAQERYSAFSAADAALAASGTVTTELALCDTPLVTAYRMGWLSALWARSVITQPFVSLLNIVAEREIIPEFLQDDCRPEVMAAGLAPLLTDTPERAAQLKAFPPLLKTLGVGGPPAAERAAEAILRWIR